MRCIDLAEAHPLHENEGVECIPQITGTANTLLPTQWFANKVVITMLKLVSQLSGITISDSHVDGPRSCVDGLPSAATVAQLNGLLPPRFDVQADDAGKPVAVAVKPILGRK